MNKLPISEHQIQNSIIDLLKYEGYKVWRNNTGAHKFRNQTGAERWVRFGQPGFSDIFAVQPKTGKFVALEVKSPGKRNCATYQQLEFIREIKEMGGIASVVCSTEEVIALLNLRTLL